MTKEVPLRVLPSITDEKQKYYEQRMSKRPSMLAAQTQLRDYANPFGWQISDLGGHGGAGRPRAKWRGDVGQLQGHWLRLRKQRTTSIGTSGSKWDGECKQWTGLCASVKEEEQSSCLHRGRKCYAGRVQAGSPVSGSGSESVQSVGKEGEIARFNERNEILHWDRRRRRVFLAVTPSISLERIEPAITVNKNKQQLSEFSNKPN